MENTFDAAFNAIGSRSLDQCERMIDAPRQRVADETDATLESIGRLSADLHQSIPEEQFRQELLNAQEEFKRGDWPPVKALIHKSGGNRI